MLSHIHMFPQEVSIDRKVELILMVRGVTGAEPSKIIALPGV
jgi:hypothetical protein